MKTENKQTTKATNLVSMDKQYTRDGKKVRVLCVDRPGLWPVLAMGEEGEISTHKEDGSFNSDGYESLYDLKQYNPWYDVAVDTKVFVKLFSWDKEVPRYFSHFKNNTIYVFQNGVTSFSNKQDAIEVYSARLA